LPRTSTKRGIQSDFDEQFRKYNLSIRVNCDLVSHTNASVSQS